MKIGDYERMRDVMALLRADVAEEIARRLDQEKLPCAADKVRGWYPPMQVANLRLA